MLILPFESKVFYRDHDRKGAQATLTDSLYNQVTYIHTVEDIFLYLFKEIKKRPQTLDVGYCIYYFIIIREHYCIKYIVFYIIGEQYNIFLHIHVHIIVACVLICPICEATLNTSIPVVDIVLTVKYALWKCLARFVSLIASKFIFAHTRCLVKKLDICLRMLHLPSA